MYDGSYLYIRVCMADKPDLCVAHKRKSSVRRWRSAVFAAADRPTTRKCWCRVDDVIRTDRHTDIGRSPLVTVVFKCGFTTDETISTVRTVCPLSDVLLRP